MTREEAIGDRSLARINKAFLSGLGVGVALGAVLMLAAVAAVMIILR